MNSPVEISVGPMAVAVNRGELTVEIVAATDIAWFDTQRAEYSYLAPAARPTISCGLS